MKKVDFYHPRLRKTGVFVALLLHFVCYPITISGVDYAQTVVILDYIGEIR